MTLTYKSPGVYIKEFDGGVKPIQPMGGAVPAFIGITAEAKTFDQDTREWVTDEDVLKKPIQVTSWAQFTRIFGGPISGAYLPDAVYGYFANGGGLCYVTSIRALKDEAGDVKSAEVAIPSTGKGNSFKVTAKKPGVEGNKLVVNIKVEKDTFTMNVGGEIKSGLAMKKGKDYIGNVTFGAVSISDVGSASAMPKDGVYALAGGSGDPLTPADFIGDPTNRTGLYGLEPLDDVRLVLCPDAIPYTYNGSEADQKYIKTIQKAMIGHCEKMRYRFAILDTPPKLNVQQVKEWRKKLERPTSYAAVYYPWIEISNLGGNGSTRNMVPPSGHIAGIYNRSDAERGVHKAPANEVVRGAIDLEFRLSRGDQDVLNPEGVNCIRAFPDRGIRVWGGRTLEKEPAWRYINVRRLFIMVEASIDAGLQWVVFEPNDKTLWAKVRRDVTSFLRTVWRSGALFGDTPEQAFYVKCDEDLNPPEIRDLGQLIIEVGLAPVKPAEFVIFRITQWAGANAES